MRDRETERDRERETKSEKKTQREAVRQRERRCARKCQEWRWAPRSFRLITSARQKTVSVCGKTVSRACE